MVVAVAAAVLRAHGLAVAQLLAMRVTAVLSAAVGVDEQAGRGRLASKSALQSNDNQLLGHGSHHVLAYHLLADHILVRIQISPLAVSQGQASNIAAPDLLGAH